MTTSTRGVGAETRPEPETLHATGELVVELAHAHLVDFVRHNFWGRLTPVTAIHHLISLALIAGLFAEAVIAGIGFDVALTRFGLGVLLAFTVLLPVHEAIHGAVYRVIGATDVRWDYQLRRFTLYVLAHRFVVSAREFILVALAPSLVINGALLVAAALGPEYRFVLLSILFVHHGGTSGDFALVSLVWQHRDRVLWTWDDGDLKKTWFYAARAGVDARYAEGDIPA